MTDRDRPPMEGSPACPFIAYEDERDERSSEPDHAHRCYAEVRPAPRALAHQEAYCLSSAFPVCPTFQAWARREAAQARSANAASASGAAAVGAAARSDGPVDAPVPPAGARVNDASTSRSEGPVDDDDGRPSEPEPLDDPDGPPARRNPPRDWAAPPPWAAGVAGATGAAAGRTFGDAPDFLASRGGEGQGLAGSAADRLATGAPVEDSRPVPRAVPSDAPASPADPELAGLVGGAAAVDRYATEPAVPPTRPSKRPSVSSTRDKPVDRTPVQTGPAWEKARRYEAYPTIKTRTGMPDIPRIVLLAGALGVAALLLFFLPALLGIGSDNAGSPSASPSASSAATASPIETPLAAPTPQVYTVKSGDTFTKIANKFGLTVEQLKAANPDIKNINKIKVGDEIVIPAAVPSEVTEPSTEPSP